MKKLVLIDGSGFIFRAFYALPPMSRADGTPTNAAFGFTRMLLAILEQVQRENGGESSVAVIFDSSRRSFRTEIYPSYKANRRDPPEELAPQFELIKKLPAAFNLPSLQLEGFEADDIIATLSTTAVAKGVPTTIISSDKDLMQLVCEQVIMRDPMKNRDIDEKAVEAYFGVPPSKVVDVQALAGDSGDNVPGAPGIGVKTAAMLINQFGSLDETLKRAKEIPQQKRRETLIAYKDAVELSRKLVTLEKQVPLDEGVWQSLAYKPLEPERLIKYLRELEFPKIIEEVRSRFGAAITPAASGDKTATRGKDKVALIKLLNKQQKVGLTVTNDDAVLAWGDNLLRLELKRERKLLKEILSGPVCKIVHDAKGMFHLFGRFHPYEDIGLMAHLLGLSDDFLSLKRIFAPDAADGAVPIAVYEKLLPMLTEKGLFSLYRSLELPLAQTLAEMEKNGIRVNAETLRQLDKKFTAAAAALQKKIHKACGREFNPGSPKQLARVLFAEMGFPHSKKGKSGEYSTSASALKNLVAQGHEVAADILKWRLFSKLKSTYIDGLLGALKKKNGRVHTTFLQNATATGRLSSQNPNLQNIPVRDDEGRAVRRAFIAEKGKILLAADYSQIELRLLAWLADVEPLKQSFSRGADIHAETAFRLFGLDSAEGVNAEHRRRAKAINFGIIYGMGRQALATSLKISPAEAGKWIEAFFRHYPQIADYMERAKEFCRQNGHIRTPLGRICRLPGIKSHRAELRAFAERAAINAPLQGAAAEIIKRAMLRFDLALRHRRLSAKLLLQIHDELLVEVAEPHAEKTAEILCKCMLEAPTPLLAIEPPLRVDYGFGHNWEELEKRPFVGY